jgi:phosphatidate cytidylyltransferase
MVLLAVFAKHHAVLVALFFCIIWLNDAAAFLIGSSIGKTPLAKSISPNKTYEGFVGGVLLASIATVLVGTQCLELSYYFLFSIAVITAITASIGDLIQSKVKRICNVKDSGRILPGHGGVYDRIDSTLFAIPVFLGMLYLFLYVS